MFTVRGTPPYLLHRSLVYCAPNVCPSAASHFLRLLCEERPPICCFIDLWFRLCSQPSPIYYFTVPWFTVLPPLAHLVLHNAFIFCSSSFLPCVVLRQFRSPFFFFVVWVFKSSEFDSLNALVPTVCSILLRDEFL
ncbi:hypothetical protein TIFTF001_007646 [Ficus carica]|uniref:Uncharacterized protein n=1 Tax=Ficus carica TaxID=3494 RepID=A0AA87ZJX9_FICCA|nr:hypothetical protein TIFTF001_007646 [Ficus carica]